jgi:SAM-dependent methyltransferase
LKKIAGVFIGVRIRKGFNIPLFLGENTMQNYGRVFAKVYNFLWNDFADNLAPQIHNFYASTPAGLNRKPVLDLCCGTGRLSHFLLDSGYRVVGIDLSEYMISYAQDNNLEFVVAKQAKFIQGDAANFKLNEKFGLTISTYDSLNHLPNVEALNNCFQCVIDVLLDGGYFIFDLNTHAGLKQWNGFMIRPGDEIYLINRGMYDEHTVKAWTKITGFVKAHDEFYERFDETVYNTVFNMADVKKWLLETGFQKVYFAVDGDLKTPIEIPEEQKRVYFIAQK